MLATELISNVIPPLKPSETVQAAIERMNELKLYHLPVVDGNQFLGLVSEEELIEVRESSVSIGKVSLSLLNAFVYDDAHIYDVIRLFHQLHLSVVPVLNHEHHYHGLVSLNGLLHYTAEIFAVKEPGGIIILEIGHRDNSLAHMAQIVEADNAQILSSYVSTFPNSTRLEVTLKINRTELSGIIATFERYGYEVKAVFNHIDDNGTADRYNSFMNYLNV